jgi:hypothetical protein
VKKVLLEILDYKDQLVHPELKVRQVLLVLQVQQVHKVLTVIREFKVLQVRRVIPEILVLLA